MRVQRPIISLLPIFLLSYIFIVPGDIRSQTSNEKVKKALHLIELGDNKIALDMLKQIVSFEPKNPDAHAGLAIGYLENEDVASAEKEVAIAYDLERKNVLVRISRGKLFGKQGKREDAIKEFNQAIKINDKEITTLLYLAHYYLSIDSLKPAEVTLYRAQTVNSVDVRPFLGLAEFYEKQHIPTLAVEQYQDAKKIDPKDITVIIKLAQLLFRAKRYNDAVVEWDNLLKIDSNYSRAYFEMAHLYDLVNDHVDAALYAEKFATREPDNLEGVWLLARSLCESGQYAKALPFLERAAKNDSLKIFTDLYLARGYFFSKDFAKSIQIYSSAKNLSPYDLYYFGFSQISKGDTTAGLEKWKQVILADTSGKVEVKLNLRKQLLGYYRIQKRYAEMGGLYLEVAKEKHSTEDYVNAGQSFNAANMLPEARAAFDSALKIDPKSLKASVGLVDIMGKNLESLDKAEEMLEDVAKNATTSEDKEEVGNSYARLGIQFYTAKNYNGTIKMLEIHSLKFLTRKSPYIINVYNVLGTANIQLKNYKKSQEYYKKVQEIDPNNEDAKKGLDFLNKMPSK